MNKIKFILFIICIAVLVLTGCSYTIEITYDNDNPYAPTFRLKEKHMIFDSLPKVREITFYKIVENRIEYSNPLWSIEADGIPIEKISYGILPNDFKVVSPVKKLTPLTKYYISVRAWGSSGFIEFQTPGEK